MVKGTHVLAGNPEREITLNVIAWDIPFFNAMAQTKDTQRRGHYLRKWIEFTDRFNLGESQALIFKEMETWFNRELRKKVKFG